MVSFLHDVIHNQLDVDEVLCSSDHIERFGNYVTSLHDSPSSVPQESNPVLSSSYPRLKQSHDEIIKITTSRRSRLGSSKFGNAKKDGPGVNRNYTQTSTENVFFTQADALVDSKNIHSNTSRDINNDTNKSNTDSNTSTEQNR